MLNIKRNGPRRLAFHGSVAATNKKSEKQERGRSFSTVSCMLCLLLIHKNISYCNNKSNIFDDVIYPRLSWYRSYDARTLTNTALGALVQPPTNCKQTLCSYTLCYLFCTTSDAPAVYIFTDNVVNTCQVPFFKPWL